MHGTPASLPILQRTDDILTWHPQIQFVEGKANQIADWLRRYPLVQGPQVVHSFPKVQTGRMVFDVRQVNRDSDDHLQLVAPYLRIGLLSPDLGSDDIITVKISAGSYTLQNDRLCRKLAQKIVHVLWSGERATLLNKFHVDYRLCEAQKLLQDIL